MRKLYYEFFYIPKYAKVREKVMLTRLTMTITVVIMCLAAMGITAYAYFSHNVTSSFNMIKAANFDLTVSVVVTNNETTDTVMATNDNTYTLTSGTYTVSLKKAGTAKTGFCIIETTVGDTKTIYHTQQIGKDVNSETDGKDSISFILNLTTITSNVTVKFTPHWGTSRYYGYLNENEELYIRNEGEIIVQGSGNVNSVSDSEDEEKEITSNETTKTETMPTEVIHTVATNETLSTIAAKYGVSVDQIAAYNEIANPNNIQAGQLLKIPTTDYKVPVDTMEPTTTTQETTTPLETTVPSETTDSTETTTIPEISAYC